MIEIRKASSSDCRAIAEVQVDSYRTAYAGFFPNSYLAHFSYEEQEHDWQEWLAAPSNDMLLVAESGKQQVIGYVFAKAEPDIYPGFDSEIAAIHVRRSNQRSGVGQRLLREAVSKLESRGCKSIMLWTLTVNPVRRWYARLQGEVIGEKSYAVDGWIITEVAYGWKKISSLRSLISG